MSSSAALTPITALVNYAEDKEAGINSTHIMIFLVAAFSILVLMLQSTAIGDNNNNNKKKKEKDEMVFAQKDFRELLSTMGKISCKYEKNKPPQ